MNTPSKTDQLDQTPFESNHGQKPFREVLAGFIIHFAVYLFVNAFLVYLDLRNPEDGYWVHWVIGGWGIGVFFHGLGVFLRWRKSKAESSN